MWLVTATLVIVDLLQRVHYGLAHYTQVPETRTVDFYPMLVALSVPALMVTAARAIGPWAPVAVPSTTMTSAGTARALIAWAISFYKHLRIRRNQNRLAQNGENAAFLKFEMSSSPCVLSK